MGGSATLAVGCAQSSGALQTSRVAAGASPTAAIISRLMVYLPTALAQAAGYRRVSEVLASQFYTGCQRANVEPVLGVVGKGWESPAEGTIRFLRLTCLSSHRFEANAVRPTVH